MAARRDEFLRTFLHILALGAAVPRKRAYHFLRRLLPPSSSPEASQCRFFALPQIEHSRFKSRNTEN